MVTQDEVRRSLFEAGAEKPAIEEIVNRYEFLPKLTPQVQTSEAEIEAKLLEFAADDVGNAEAFFYLHGNNFKHSKHIGWVFYTGTHWAGEGKDAAKVLADAVIDTLRRRRVAAAKVGDAAKPVYMASTQTAKHVRDCIGILAQMKAVSIGVSEFNAADDKINCANGVVNLRTGEIEPHNPKQYFNYCIPTAYDPNADQSEVWAFLDAALEFGHPVAKKLQLALGYCMTGDLRLEKFIYITGKGRSGKGTLKQVIEQTIGKELMKPGVFASFVKKKEENSNNFDLAALKDARIVVCDEGGKDSKLSEGKVKQLSGGGSITASFKHKDAFEFEPKFKLVFISNHNIDADPNDDAFWHRLILFSFPHSHVGDSEDPSIKARLISKELRPAWLAWFVDGAKEFYAGGYKRFESTDDMKAMIEKRREDLDTQGRWFKDECEAVEGEVTPYEKLRKSYVNWSQARATYVKNDKEFTDWLDAHDFKTKPARVEGKVTKVRDGIRLVRPPEMAGSLD